MSVSSFFLSFLLVIDCSIPFYTKLLFYFCLIYVWSTQTMLIRIDREIIFTLSFLNIFMLKSYKTTLRLDAKYIKNKDKLHFSPLYFHQMVLGSTRLSLWNNNYDKNCWSYFGDDSLTVKLVTRENKRVGESSSAMFLERKCNTKSQLIVKERVVSFYCVARCVCGRVNYCVNE